MNKTSDWLNEKILSCLKPAARQELQHYLRYLLLRQLGNEVEKKLFQDERLRSLSEQLEIEPHRPERVKENILRFKKRYYELLSEFYEEYADFSFAWDDLSLARDFGYINFEQVEQAFLSGNMEQIRFEVRELCQGWQKLLRRAG